MKIRVLGVFFVVLAAALASEAQLCKNCYNYRCYTDVSGSVNCMSNGTECRRWTACTSNGGGGDEDCGITTPCDGYAELELETEPAWRLASVEVCPAAQTDVQWRLASVEIVTPRRWSGGRSGRR